MAGAIARGFAQTLLHPVDVIRTRIQARDVVMSWKPAVFMKGVVPQISLAIPAGAIQFLAFEAAKDKLKEWFPDEKISQTRLLVAGAIGALAAATCRVPQEVLKQRIQADIYPNIVVAVKETLIKQGPGSLYKGSMATISRDVPWNALSFMFHGQGKKIFESIKGRKPANDENLVIAGMSGAIAAIIMTPVDVVKTRIMTQSLGHSHYSGIIGTLKKIVAEEGAPTLMKGVLPRIVFLAPLAGITFSVYEGVVANIRKRKALAAEASINGAKDAVADQSVAPGDKIATALPQRGMALRFSQRAHKRSQASNCNGDTLADYATSNAIFFSLPA